MYTTRDNAVGKLWDKLIDSNIQTIFIGRAFSAFKDEACNDFDKGGSIRNAVEWFYSRDDLSRRTSFLT